MKPLPTFFVEALHHLGTSISMANARFCNRAGSRFGTIRLRRRIDFVAVRPSHVRRESDACAEPDGVGQRIFVRGLA